MIEIYVFGKLLYITDKEHDKVEIHRCNDEPQMNINKWLTQDLWYFKHGNFIEKEGGFMHDE